MADARSELPRLPLLEGAVCILGISVTTSHHDSD